MSQYTSNSTSTKSSVKSDRLFLEIDNLFKSYKNADGSESSVLENINLSIGGNEFISVIGHSGCGKSTLLNTLLGVKVAPITAKPQTTRRGVRGIYTDEGRQLVFVDTPGFSRAKDALGEYMNREVRSAVVDVDLILWVVDLRRRQIDGDANVAGPARRPGAGHRGKARRWRHPGSDPERPRRKAGPMSCRPVRKHLSGLGPAAAGLDRLELRGR